MGVHSRDGVTSAATSTASGAATVSGKPEPDHGHHDLRWSGCQRGMPVAVRRAGNVRYKPRQAVGVMEAEELAGRWRLDDYAASQRRWSALS